MSLQDDLYTMLLESPLGVHGAEQTLPALSELLRALRRKDFWEGRRRRRLSEEQMIRAWATYRRDLRELRERMRQRNQDQEWDDFLSWLVMFLLDHYQHLARVSALYQPAYQLIIDRGGFGGLAAEDELALRADWQSWVVAWLRDALRDEDLDAGPAASGGTGDGDDDGGLTQDQRPKPKPDDPALDF